MRWLAAFAVLAGCGRVGFDADGRDGGSTLAIDPPAATINTGSRLQLTASGGTEPYNFELIGDGFIDPATGLFVSPSNVGVSTVRVVDATDTVATAEVTYRGSTIFVAGGLISNVATTSVYASTDGAAWALVGTLPAALGNGALVVWNDRMLYIGGSNGTPKTPIYESTNGVTWTQVGTLPAPSVSMPVISHQGALWMVSGYNGTGDHPEVRRSSDGIVWTTVGTFPAPRHEHDMVSRKGKLYVFGGHGTAASLYTDILTSNDGMTWQTEPTTLSFMTDFQGSGQLGTRVVRSCGTTCSSVEATDDFVTWTTGTLPDGPRDGPSIVTFNGKMLMIGGGTQSILASTDGVTWVPVGNFVVPNLVRASAVVFTPP